MEILLKRSQITLTQLHEVLSRFFAVERVVQGRRELLVGRTKADELMGGLDVRAILQMDVPLADREIGSRLDMFLSRFSSSLYRVKVRNLDLRNLLALLEELQGMGVDLGFVEEPSLAAGRSYPLGGRERFRWPKDKEAQMSMATELHKLYSQIIPKAPLIDLDFFILSLRSIRRRKFRTASLAAVMGLVCANFIYHINFSISGDGLGVIVEQWELPLAAGAMAIIMFLNLMQISLRERMLEVGTIRALGAETTTTLQIFAAEGMMIGGIGAMLGYVIVVVASVVVKFGGLDPGLSLVSACGPGKAILGLFLGLIVGLVGAVLPVIFVVWRPPEKCLKVRR